jgi:peroxiredoxin
MRAVYAPFLMALLLLTACNTQAPVSAAGEAGHTKPAGDRKAAPDFDLKDADGKTVKLSDYKGKVVLLNFWATWCGPCKIETPWFVEFERKYKDQGFAVVGVSMDEEGWPAVKPYVAEMGINYRMLLGNDSIAALYGGLDALPTTFILDREGKVAATHVGLAGKSEFENGIKELLSQKAAAAPVVSASLR